MSTKNYVFTEDGDSQDQEPGVYTHTGGILRFMRHDDATVSAGTTKLQFRPAGKTNLQDLKDKYETAELTESGMLEISCPACEINVNLAGYGGTGNIDITLESLARRV